MSAPTPESILLEKVRPYYTTRRCRVETAIYMLSNGSVVEDVTLSRLSSLFADDVQPRAA